MRSFIALPVDDKTSESLSAISKRLQTLSWANQVRWFPEENYHLTLQFLGSKIPQEKIQQVMDSMEEWFSEGMSFFEAEVRQIQLFPTPKKPHTVIASLDATLPMQYLVREIEQHLKPIGLEARKQTFRPHISLGRIKTHSDPSAIHIPSDISRLDDIWLKVERITLYESQLTHTSPIYTPLKSIRLESYD
ncbi:RNA 2',3'-cyclic phosphodiesterase [Thiomicrorhabdus sp. 6S3-12]|uniref:RNA 2',3'-cyclic phosphodiesterase n=1 Tax=Thiomicrorhabdus sp. 6S3-12 TaxID=2819681 RepID=UPI001AAD893D|nr:RNA 2',3'-cyclic phosphodiesterase [Thiomicrorhabdus sp. 6S3-12]MBO1924590.1 RNA 2',3'-cyclic phosphodiesterase [Thiomicrorhabdus sp. 6S3-12]